MLQCTLSHEEQGRLNKQYIIEKDVFSGICLEHAWDAFQ